MRLSADERLRVHELVPIHDRQLGVQPTEQLANAIRSAEIKSGRHLRTQIRFAILNTAHSMAAKRIAERR